MGRDKNFDALYQSWIDSEKKRSDEAFKSKIEHRTVNIRFRDRLPMIGYPKIRKSAHGSRFTVHGYIRIGSAAAVLVLALFTTLILTNQINWFDKKPQYTQAQIELSYEHAVKTLALCAGKISNEMDILQNLDRIPKSFDQLKKFKTVIKE